MQRVIDFVKLFEFLSTPSARRATINRFGFSCGHIISIHALREEGDSTSTYTPSWIFCISIHALREEGDYARYGSRHPGK